MAQLPTGTVTSGPGTHGSPYRSRRPRWPQLAGLAVHQVARISSATHGGQEFASVATRASCGTLGDGASWRALGRHRLKAEAMELFQLCHRDLEAEPPILGAREPQLSRPAVDVHRPRRGTVAGEKLLSATRLLSVTGRA